MVSVVKDDPSLPLLEKDVATKVKEVLKRSGAAVGGEQMFTPPDRISIRHRA